MNQTTRLLQKTCGESDSENSIESATCIEGMKSQQEKTNKKCNDISNISEKFEDKQEVNQIIANQTEDNFSGDLFSFSHVKLCVSVFGVIQPTKNPPPIHLPW